MAVAALLSWHEGHDVARGIVESGVLLPAPAAVETFAVLTRLSGDRRVPAPAAWESLAESFPQPWPVLDADGHRRAVERVVEARVAGGATYDAMIALTAEGVDAMLVSADRRAVPTYERLGVSFRLV